MTRYLSIGFFAATIGFIVAAGTAFASQHSTDSPQMGGMMEGGMMANGMLKMPQMDPVRGRELFVNKSCVVCHSINGVGGQDAPPLDAATMEQSMNPFVFAAKMWGGAEAMIYLQREELGEQIEFTGGELADIIAFVHDPVEQVKFSESDIPDRIKALMHHIDEDEPHEEEGIHIDKQPHD